MYSFFCVSPILSLYLILARARPENLFLLDSLHNSLDAPSDDVSFLWNPDETTLDSTGLASNPLDQDIDLMGDVDSVGNSNDPFTSNIMGLTALPSCKSEGSQTDGVLKARDGESCRPKETVDLPTEIFQDPEAYLRGNLDTPKGQNNQHGQGDQKDENMNSGFLTPDFKEDEKICPSEIFGPSNIPVCRNTLTGVMDSEVASNAVTLFNAIPYTRECPEFSALFCCALGRKREFLLEEAINPSEFNPEELEFLSRLGDLAYDARYCWWKELVVRIGVPVEILEGE